MDESAPIRAITIGVSVLLAVATISAVLMYYNTAKQMASNVGRGQDFAGNYEQGIKNILLNGSYNVSGNNYITGTDVKNLINYFYDDDSVDITIQNMKCIAKYEGNKPIVELLHYQYTRANQSISGNYENAIKNILPDQRFVILKKEENVKLTKGRTGTNILIDGIL